MGEIDERKEVGEIRIRGGFVSHFSRPEEGEPEEGGCWQIRGKK